MKSFLAEDIFIHVGFDETYMVRKLRKVLKSAK